MPVVVTDARQPSVHQQNMNVLPIHPLVQEGHCISLVIASTATLHVCFIFPDLIST